MKTAGIGDRLSVLDGFQRLAILHNATLAIVPPKEALGGGHNYNKNVASWWDDYFLDQPPLVNKYTSKCLSGKITYTKNPDFINTKSYYDIFGKELLPVPDNVRESFLSGYGPLCLHLDFDYYAMKYGLGEDRPQYHWIRDPNVMGYSRKAGNKVRSLFNDLVKNVKLLRKPYNSVHIRRSDKAKNCNDVEKTLLKIKSMNAENPENKKYPWLVLTDGDELYIQEFIKKAKKENIKLLMEHNLYPHMGIDAQNDNYLKYAILTCLHAFAYNRLETFHTIKWSSCGYIEDPGQTSFICDKPHK